MVEKIKTIGTSKSPNPEVIKDVKEKELSPEEVYDNETVHKEVEETEDEWLIEF